MQKTNIFSKPFFYLGLMALVFILSFCSKETAEVPVPDPDPTPDSTELPDVYQKIYGASQIYLDGNFVVIQSNGVPDHGSPYFNSGNSNYEAYNGTNSSFHLNPNRISSQSFTFRIPLNPSKASNSTATPLGPIGVSLNGVPFYNQYAGPNNRALTNEINSFDQFNGHPQQSGQYHYHIEPLFLTQEKGKDALLGFLTDGFPVYGPEEDGKRITNSDLDAYHGHTSKTEDYPDGIYHYHITDEDPYLNGNGFYGTPGTISN